MATTHSIQFVHRANLDGTFDSICPECIATVGTGYSEDSLAALEMVHICDPHDLERFERIPTLPKLNVDDMAAEKARRPARCFE